MNPVLWGVCLTVITIALLLVAVTHARQQNHPNATTPCEDQHDATPGTPCTCGRTELEDA